MLRYVTAGESHGPKLIAVLEGLPSHVQVATEDLSRALARRRLGAGRGARMGFEQDEVRMIAGVRHGETIGSPVAIEIGNTEWPSWVEVMSPDAVDPEKLAGLARNEPLTRPRPGHVDLAGMQKYDFAEARPLLERASARETAARVAAGEVARALLRQAAGIEVVSHVVALGGVFVPRDLLPTPENAEAIDADPVRCFDSAASAAMVARVEEAKKAGETLGGVVEVLAFGLPPGLGSHVFSDRRLDARLAGALMGVQAIKGVEFGDGFALADVPGSQAHDEIELDGSRLVRRTDRAGGVEGGMSNGAVLRVRAAMKPIATVPNALRTVDLSIRQPTSAHHQRSDVCAVPAAAVVAEAAVAFVLADALLEKTGGDTLAEVRRNLGGYLDHLAARGLT